MQLFFRDDDGKEIPIPKVFDLHGNGALILQSDSFLHKETREEIEQYCSEKIGRPVLLVSKPAYVVGVLDERSD